MRSPHSPRWERRPKASRSRRIHPAGTIPGGPAALRLGPKVLGAFGELHPAVIEALDARPPLAGFEVFLDAVPEPRAARAKPPVHLSVFQPIERDFAFVVDRELPAETLLRAARGVDRKLVSEIRLFDVYEGAGLPEGKKSLAITVVLQPQERTLTDAEIEGFLEAPDRPGRKGHRRAAARLTKPAVAPGRCGSPCSRAENRAKNRIEPFRSPIQQSDQRLTCLTRRDEQGVFRA